MGWVPLCSNSDSVCYAQRTNRKSQRAFTVIWSETEEKAGPATKQLILQHLFRPASCTREARQLAGMLDQSKPDYCLSSLAPDPTLMRHTGLFIPHLSLHPVLYLCSTSQHLILTSLHPYLYLLSFTRLPFCPLFQIRFFSASLPNLQFYFFMPSLLAVSIYLLLFFPPLIHLLSFETVNQSVIFLPLVLCFIPYISLAFPFPFSIHSSMRPLWTFLSSLHLFQLHLPLSPVQPVLHLCLTVSIYPTCYFHLAFRRPSVSSSSPLL